MIRRTHRGKPNRALQRIISHTVDRREDVDDEIRYLLRVLSQRRGRTA